MGRDPSPASPVLVRSTAPPTTINDLIPEAAPVLCAICHQPLNLVLAAIEDITHPACGPT